MSIRNGMVRHTLLLSLASIWMRGIGMLFQVWLSSRIHADGIGLLQLIGTVSVLASTLGTAGVRVGAMYLIADARGRNASTQQVTNACLRYSALASTLAAVTLFAAAPKIGIHWLQNTQTIAPLRLCALFLPSSCLCAVLSGWFTACVKIKQLTILEVILQAVLFGANALLLSQINDSAQCCQTIITVNGVGDIAMLFLLSLLYRRGQRNDAQTITPHLWHKLLHLCLPLALSDLLRAGLSTAEHLLIPRGLTTYGLEQQTAMAVYGTIHGMTFPVMMFPATLLYAFSDLLVPELARCVAAGSTQRVHYLTGRCLKFGTLFACFTAGFFFCLAQPLAQLLYPGSQTGQYLQLFAPLLVMLYLDAVVDAMLKGLGQQVASVRFNCITSALDILLLLWLLPRYGIGGYYWAFVLSHGVNFFLSITRLLRVTAHPPALFYACKIILCTMLCAVGGRILLQPYHGIAAVLFGSGGYTLALFCLLRLCGALRRSDLHWMRRLLQTDASL